jgi:hypothetical protein
MNATSIRMRQDNTEYQARRFVHQMLGLLQNYIPRACEREVCDVLMKAALDQGFELTSKAMREQYEAWQKLQLDVGMCG